MSKVAERSIIEDAINKTLTGDTQKNALDFAAFLRANGYSAEHDGNWWCVKHGDDCPILLGIDGFGVVSGVKFGALFNYCNFDESGIVDEGVKETAWAHVQICSHYESSGTKCGCGDQPEPIAIFGKEFHACKCPLTFIDPDAKTLEHMKKLMLLQRS